MKTINKAKDLGNYHANELPDELLAEDWRLVNDLYAAVKSGKSPECSEEQVVDLATEILAELLVRHKTKFHPKDMKPLALELFAQCIATVLALEKGVKPKKSDELLKQDDKEDEQVRQIPEGDFPEFVWIPDFISDTGSEIYGKHEPNDQDVVIRADSVDDALAVKLKRIYQANGKIPHLIPSTLGATWSYVSRYDLVLRPKKEFKVTEVEEPDFQDKFYKQLEKKSKEEGIAGEFGNIDFKSGMKGMGVLQLHMLGLSEKEAEKIKKNGKVIMSAIKKGMKPFATLIKSLVKAGAHIDVRLAPDGKDYWEGGEIFIGNVKGLSKITGYKDNDKLRYQWKQSRAGEKKTEVVRGALAWMEEGSRKPAIYKPGEIGALAKTWGALIRLDKFKWEAGTQDEHYREFKFGWKIPPPGRWIYTFVPTEKGRVWMMSRPSKQEMDKQEKKEVKKAFDRRIPFIKMDDEKRLIYGVVYSPNEIDEQGDWISAEEIEKAAHNFLIDYRKIGINHRQIVKGCKVAECYITLTDMNIGDSFIKKGSWMMVTRVDNNDVWQDAKDGGFTGYSIGGTAHSSEQEEE